MSQFIEKLKRVKIHDLLQVWKLIAAPVPAMIYRMFHRDLWIICEDEKEARDNGFWIFRYIRRNAPEQECVYAIRRDSVDYDKVSSLGRTVEYGSLKHWILYLASAKKISSQKAGNPNAAIFYFLEVYGLLKDKRVFLQHGITINNAKWLYYDVTKMTRFICGSYPEYEYIQENFGYPEENVVYAGMCRFDGLHDAVPDPRLILIMPTWREWIADEDYRLKEYEGTEEIPKTNYFVKWTAFIQDERLAEIAAEYNVRFVFFPHRNMQKYMQYFPASTEWMEIASSGDWDIQDLMKKCALMITDYSSVCFDIFYMKKPLIFYQFDYDQFRRGQYDTGVFDYRNNGFAVSLTEKDDVIDKLEKYIRNGYAVSEEYLQEHRNHFRLYDRNNCERVYRIIKDL